MEALVDNKLIAINWEDPANTNNDIEIVINADNPIDTDKAPKIIPKGIAAKTKGKVSNTPIWNDEFLFFISIFLKSFKNFENLIFFFISLFFKSV